MKAFGALLILVLVGYAGYQYAYQPVVDLLGLDKMKPAETVGAVSPPAIVNVEPAPGPSKKKVEEESKAEMPKIPEPTPQPAPMPTPTPAPAVAQTMGA